MRILVTGASGNVGTVVLRHLVERGHDVVGVCRRTPPAVAPYDRVAWHSVDLSTDVEGRLVELMAGVDAVVHLAWGFQPTRDEAYHRRLGVEGTAQVVRACHRAGVPRLVHQSSVGVYAPTDDEGPGMSTTTRVTEDAPRGGVPTSMYNAHKTAAEEVLDRHEAEHPSEPAVVRLRPGFIVHAEAASGLARYFLPGLVPAQLVRLLKVLPVDRRLVVPIVHGDDMARAMVAAVEGDATGAFNIAAEPPVTRDDLASALGAVTVGVPLGVLRRAVDLTWRAHLQPVSIGWVDLAFAAPVMDTTAARQGLGWTPQRDAMSAVREIVDALAAGRSGASAPLRARCIRDTVAGLLRGGPVDVRRRS